MCPRKQLVKVSKQGRIFSYMLLLGGVVLQVVCFRVCNSVCMAVAELVPMPLSIPISALMSVFNLVCLSLVACVYFGAMHLRLVPCTLSFFCVLIPSLKSCPLLFHEVNMSLNVLYCGQDARVQY